MNRRKMRGSAPSDLPSRRDVAQFGKISLYGYRPFKKWCECNCEGFCTSKQTPSHCQHRYPSPCRSVHFLNGPAIYLAHLGNFSAIKRFCCRYGLVLAASSRDFGHVKNAKKGNLSCSRHLLSSQLLQPSALVHAPGSTQTASARLSARALVRWLQVQRAMTQPLAHLPVQLQVRSATTSTSAANTSNKAVNAQAFASEFSRRWDMVLAAVLRSKDKTYV